MKHTEPPRPDWKIGDRVQAPFQDFASIDISKTDQQSAYKLLIGCVVPRPIAFVSTVSSQGVGNLAPFSFFNAVASRPMSVMFSVTQKSDGSIKDTLQNILETREFVVNSVNEWIV